MSVTIYDVATKAGVSFQLASAVLGRKKYARASEATRKRIFDAARKLDYRSNTAAAILAGGQSRIIGVLIDSRAPETMYSILAEIEQLADRHGYRILSAQAHDQPEKLLSSYHSLKQTGVDGIISFSHDYSQFGCHLDQRLRDDPRIVFVINTDESNISAVDVDIKGGIIAAAEHLRSRGYRKTALLLSGGKTLDTLPQSSRKRLEGFRLGCPDGEVFLLRAPRFEISLLEKECRRLIREKLIPEKFDSAIALNDFLAVVLMNQLMDAGVRIPQEFGVVGCDDLPISACFPIKLTTLRYDRAKLAHTALNILLDKIAGNTDPVRKVFPMELIIRESTCKNSRLKD